jgi:hypothetical protein
MATDLSEAEAVKVAAFGLDRPEELDALTIRLEVKS